MSIKQITAFTYLAVDTDRETKDSSNREDPADIHPVIDYTSSSTTVPSSLSAGTQGKWDAFPPQNVYKCMYGRRNNENDETEQNNIM